MSLVVFTAMIGETEPLRAPKVVNPGVRYLCFSDRPCTVAPYEWIRVPETDDPRKLSRRIKILAEHPVLQAATGTLWHDASYRLLRDPLWAQRRLARDPMVALRHQRPSIEDEAVLIARYGYVTLETARATVDLYRAEGFRDYGMTAGGLLARRGIPAVRAFNQLWWHESQTRWGGRDQISLNYCAWKCELRIGHIQGTIKQNRYAAWRVPAAAPASEPVGAIC